MKHPRGRALLRPLLAVVVLILVAGGFLGFDYVRFTRAPLAIPAAGDTIDVGRGTSFRDIVADLRQRGITRASPWYWRALAAQMGVAGRLHAGEYALMPGTTPRGLLDSMAAGRVIQRYVTIVDGWTFLDLRHALARGDKLSQVAASLSDDDVMKQIGAPGQFPEGRFLPETYAYVKGDSDLDILKRAHAAMAKALDQAWANRATDLPLASADEALILASIVEKETGRADERPRIAGVFVRRLQQHMLLQTDPTVIYGMGAAYAGNIHKADLGQDTPYNTYTRAGLPPTPIAMPGKPALEAATHPAAGSELYFVSRGDGSHVFSASLAEHNRAVACYQLHRCQ
ncbi:endolytic transglycosylase MltG [Pinirhizobacter soli]|uniref:endolytic transglycosylase MltG n=1 Tax=Pinirhizobacter soli TaxID=2786953 RepID=UPI00202A42BC|nr:endolytic transglycosylase MltG [Pinirhizobacter soli]